MIECDKSMSRLDAVQKHLRGIHGDIIHVGGPNTTTKRRKPNRAGSVESDSTSRPLAPEELAPRQATTSTEIVWTENERAWAGRFEGCSMEYVGYVVEKAKFNYLLKEHEGMLAELEVLMTSEAEMGTECDELLDMIMRKELPQPGSTSVLLPPFLHAPPLRPSCRLTGDQYNAGRTRRKNQDSSKVS